MNHPALLQLGHALAARGYTFVTPTPATHARVNARPGNAWATDLAGVLGWSRPFEPGLLPQDIAAPMHAAGILAPVSLGGRQGFRASIRVSTLNGMMYMHSAYPTEAADSVFFGPDTYRFTAAIDAWLQHGHPVDRAVDIGCGAGPGAMTVAAARPQAIVIAADINPAALRLTETNATLAGLGNVAVQHSDLLSMVSGPLDLIVANPPYLADASERAYRHGGGPLGAGLSLSILDAALVRLSAGGTLLLYTGAAIVNGLDPFHAAAADRLAGSRVRWTYREIDPDVFGEELDTGAYRSADRIAAVLLTATRED